MKLSARNVFRGRIVRAALGNPQAMDQLLRFVHDAHDILQPAKGEAKDGDTAPIRPVFRRACTHEPPPDQARNTGDGVRTAEPAPPPTGLVVDGQLYE